MASIKSVIAHYFLKKDSQSSQRKCVVSNFDTAKSFGLLFDANDPEIYELVKKYFKYLKESKKKVHAIGFYDLKNLPQMEYSKLDYDFFTRKDLNWWGKPGGTFVTNFIEEEYDVLINFSLNDSFPLKYISAMSKAKMKIGKLDEKNSAVYDMMIQQPADKNFKFFMRQVDHYLGIINKPRAVNEKF
jgi:hypothetical protein